jgi:integrase
MARQVVAQLLEAIDALDTREPYGLMARLMYGAGLRLLECCRLRVKDVDLGRNTLTVRQGKGDKDRPQSWPRRRAQPTRQPRWLSGANRMSRCRLQ